MDRILAMRAFSRVVERGSFSRAAADVGVKQSTVSKWVAQLEEELGAVLVHRTTRSSSVTEEGQRFYERCREILSTWDLARVELSGGVPRLQGRLRVSAPLVFGRLFVTPHLAVFARRHPAVALDVRLDDRYLDMVEHGLDVSIRVGLPTESSLRRHVLGETRRCLVAAPEYLRDRGEPTTAEQLREHACLRHSGVGTEVWALRRGGRVTRATVGGALTANNSEVLLTMAEAGMGVALLANWLVAESLAAGRLVEVLREYNLPPAPIHALLPPQRAPAPKSAAFVAFMGEVLGRDARLHEVRRCEQSDRVAVAPLDAQTW